MALTPNPSPASGERSTPRFRALSRSGRGWRGAPGEGRGATRECLYLDAHPSVLLDRVRIERDAEARGVRDGEHAVGVEVEAFKRELVDVGGAGDVFDEIGVGEGAGEVEVSGETEGGVPAVRDEA